MSDVVARELTPLPPIGSTGESAQLATSSSIHTPGFTSNFIGEEFGGMLILNSGTGAEGLAMFWRLIKPLLLSPWSSQKLVRYFSEPNPKDLKVLADLADGGSLRPQIDSEFDLEDTADALPFRPERVLAEASFRAYTSAKGAEDETAPTLFLKAEDALGRLLGRVAVDLDRATLGRLDRPAPVAGLAPGRSLGHRARVGQFVTHVIRRQVHRAGIFFRHRRARLLNRRIITRLFDSVASITDL